MATIVHVLWGVNFPSSLYLAQQAAFCNRSLKSWLMPPLSPISRWVAVVPGSCRMLSTNLRLQSSGLRWDTEEKRKEEGEKKKPAFLNDIPNYTLFRLTNKNSFVVSRLNRVHHNFDSEYWGWTGSLNNFPVYALLFQFNASIWQTQKLYLLMPGHDQNL